MINDTVITGCHKASNNWKGITALLHCTAKEPTEQFNSKGQKLRPMAGIYWGQMAAANYNLWGILIIYTHLKRMRSSCSCVCYGLKEPIKAI